MRTHDDSPFFMITLGYRRGGGGGGIDTRQVKTVMRYDESNVFAKK